MYRIVIDPTSQSGDDTNFTQLPKLSTIIEKGFRLNATTGENQTYLGIGSGSVYKDNPFPFPPANSNTHFHVVTEKDPSLLVSSSTLGHGIQVGTKGQIDANWHISYEYGADIVGRIRMQETASGIGQVITSVDADGTMQWTDSTAVGQWIEDPNCSSRIVLAEDKFASTLNNDNVNYSRFDIAVNQTDSAQAPQADLIFINYANSTGFSSPGDSDFATYSITLDHLDGSQTGQLSVNVYSDQQPCQSDLGSPDGTNRYKVQTWDSNGRIRMGNLNSIGSGIELGVSDRLYIQSSDTTNISGNQPRIRANIFLGNEGSSDSFESPLIKFSTTSISEPFPNQMNAIDQTSLEILRTFRASQQGAHNIRFKGTGNSPNQTFSTAGPNETQQTQSKGGAHVMMISDLEGATARNGNLENTNDYYELDHTKLFVDKCRLAYTATKNQASPPPGGTPTQMQTSTVSHLITLDKWGSAGSGWTTYGTGAPVFTGSRSTSDVFDDSRRRPNRLNSYDNRETIVIDNSEERSLSIQNLLPASITTFGGVKTSGGPAYLNVWNSPTSSFRYTPINLSEPSFIDKKQTGIAMVNFNIDIGLVIETNEIAGSAKNRYQTNGQFWSFIAGPGSLSHQNFADPSKTSKSRYHSPLDQFKIQSVRVRLDSDAVRGIGPMLSAPQVQNPSITSLDPNNPNAPRIPIASAEESSVKNYATDWLPGVCKSMYGELKSNNATAITQTLYNNPEANGIDFQNALDNASLNTLIPANPLGVLSTRLFGNGVATGALTPTPNLYTNQQNQVQGIGWIFDSLADFAPKWQNAPIMWRLEINYDTSMVPAPGSGTYVEPKETYLHIMYMRNPASDAAGVDRPYDLDSTDWQQLDNITQNTIGGGYGTSVANGPFGSGIAPTTSNEQNESGNDTQNFASYPNTKFREFFGSAAQYGSYSYSAGAGNLGVQSYAKSVANSYGIPINYLVAPQAWNEYEKSNPDIERMTLEYLLMNIKREDEFYQTHGLGFSGSGLVRWNSGGQWKYNAGFAELA